MGKITFISVIGLFLITASASCGKKRGIATGIELEPAIIGGGGLGGGGSIVSVEECRDVAVANSNFDIVPVTQIVEATNGIAGWVYNGGGVSAANDYPFTGQVFNIGDDPATVIDGQVAFQFLFDYPANNYQFSNARLVIDTSRDTSDTEGIFVDGIFSGVPPSMVNTASPNITHPVYSNAQGASNGTGENTYYIDFSLSHYKHNQRNTFDLSLADLITPTGISSGELLSDGKLNVVTGDDSPVFQAYLVMRGLTIATEDLVCENSDTYTFTNVYLHEDGNTTGESAFIGSSEDPYTTWSNPGVYDNTEFYYDAPLPSVGSENITITSAKLSIRAKKTGSGDAAIVINGLGVSTTGFDRSSATSAVESWDDSATAKFDTFMTGVSTNVNGTTTTLDLIDLFGASQVRTLLAQGKLNLAINGDLFVRAANTTSARDFGTPISGPELLLDGTYFAEVCQVPNNSNSPLNEDGFVPPEPEYKEVCEIVERDASEVDAGSVISDGDGPTIASLKVLDITSSSAKIVWSTNENGTSEVFYGVGNTSDASEISTKPTTFHQVTLSGLSPYKFYNFIVATEDAFGNRTVTETQTFRTLR